MRVINVLKTTNIIQVGSDQTLAHGLSQLKTSHDAAFVFEEDSQDKFLGVINPYYSVIKNSYPGNAKIEHSLFHPPHLKTNFPISKVAQLMIESKIHYLPVFDNDDHFTGIVSARNLLSHLKDSATFDVKIEDYLKGQNKPLLTAYEDDLVSSAIALFKSSKLSKLIVINRDMKLKGILTYYDLVQFLMTPRNKQHMGDREGQRVSFTAHRVKNFAKTYVLTLSPKNTFKDALKLILDKGIGSVVVVDEEKHPVGIITTREFLRLIAKVKEVTKIEVVSKNLSPKSTRIVSGFFDRIKQNVQRVPNLARAKLFIKEEKQGGVFKAILSLIPRKGEVKIIHSEGKNLEKVLDKIKKN